MEMNGIANVVLDKFHEEGLYTATKDSKGNFVINRTKLSKEKYAELKKIFSNLNNSGRNSDEQKQIDKKKQRLNEATSIPRGSKL